MRFAKPLLAFLGVLLLSACASSPEQPNDAATAEPDMAEAEASEQAFNAALPPGPVTLNPYLQSPAPKVSANIQSDFATAQQQMRQQRWSDARHTLQALVVQAPELSGPWLNLGIVWVQLNEPGQARAAFERALAANPLNVDAYNRLAALERREGQFSEAEKLYQDALAVWPHSVASHKNLGVLYDLYLGNWPQALLHYEAAQHIVEQTKGEPDRQLAGWIIDLQRRIAAGGQP